MAGSVAIIIQARMGSERLPGKILKNLSTPALPLPMLQFEIDRLKQIPSKPRILLATTTNSKDDETERFAKRIGIECVRGSETDVLDRYYHAAKQIKADIILRITADCPLIDPEICEQVIQAIQAGKYDYVSNVLKRTYPRGLDVEAFTFSTLEKLHREVKEPRYREHVTLYIVENRNQFKTHSIESPQNYSQYRLTVDTPEDFELIQRIILALMPTKPNFRMADVVELLSQHPDWCAINAHIEQKKA